MHQNPKEICETCTIIASLVVDHSKLGRQSCTYKRAKVRHVVLYRFETGCMGKWDEAKFWRSLVETNRFLGGWFRGKVQGVGCQKNRKPLRTGPSRAVRRHVTLPECVHYRRHTRKLLHHVPSETPRKKRKNLRYNMAGA